MRRILILELEGPDRGFSLEAQIVMRPDGGAFSTTVRDRMQEPVVARLLTESAAATELKRLREEVDKLCAPEIERLRAQRGPEIERLKAELGAAWHAHEAASEYAGVLETENVRLRVELDNFTLAEVAKQVERIATRREPTIGEAAVLMEAASIERRLAGEPKSSPGAPAP